MAGGTLYTYPDNFKAFKGLIAAEYSGTKVNVSSEHVWKNYVISISIIYYIISLLANHY